jgi:hypothetical protein
MDENDFEIFKGKKFSELCKDIYKNSSHKKDQIDVLIGELRQLIKNQSDAVLIVPLIREYLDVGVQNDEHLIKLAAVVQRFINSISSENESSGDSILSEEEKKQLFEDVQKTIEGVNDNSINNISDKVDKVKEKLEKG